MRIIKNKLTWIDILNPTKKDIEFINKGHKFHPIILDELFHASARSKVESYKKYLFLTYHMPIYDNKLKTSRRAEVDFIVTKDKVITVHYEDLEPINNFWRKLSNNKLFKDRVMKDNTGFILYYLIEEILAFSERQLRHIESKTTDVSKRLFQNREAALLENISYLKRDILDYSIISKPQKTVLESLKEVAGGFWNKDMKIYFSDLTGDHLKIIQHLENFKETVAALGETNAQLLNAKTNAVMQKFTVLAFLTYPLVILTSLFDIKVVDNIMANHQIMFVTSFGIVFIVTIIMLAIFKKRGWL